jgi:small conductance mechanosensitive channel
MFLSPIHASFILAMRWGVFQEGRFLGKVLDEWIADSQEFVHTKLPKLIVIAIIAFIFSRLLHLLTHHMAHLAETSGAGSERLSEVRTMSGVIRATGLAIIGLIAGFMCLDAIGFNLAPLLASAGIAGIAIGLAAQTIVKDVLNGFLILVEGQFSVGDQVRVAGVSGVVEALTLRRTSVRDADGTLYVIPNSQITTVANLSSGYAVASVNVSVDFSADPDAVTKLLKKIAMDVRNSDEFRDAILEDPKVLGLDSVKGSQMVFPVLFKTRANQQYGLVREFQRRVRLALEENHLLPGDPNRVFQHRDDADAAGASRRAEEAPAPVHDPTTLKPQESNPFSGE